METPKEKATQPTKPLEEEHKRVELLESDKILKLDSSIIPWAERAEEIGLKLVRLNGGVSEFYYADFIRGNRLITPWGKVDKAGKMEDINEMLFNRIEGMLQDTGGTIYVRRIEHPRTKRPIIKLANANQERNYIIQFDNIEGKPVIIRIALCADVTSENNDVMPVISTVKRKK